ncbi:hypothetical protein Y1Q_0003435 [Alligator mississippiensis]|uniref:Uncharacterized protein n=1 Tax=Alligator mississippiensis TaxID=8496 RepID=A0A151N536_ALLMI|nr:hypothetical protein Y1Q_0003435 [Alligator mississippiensis]
MLWRNAVLKGKSRIFCTHGSCLCMCVQQNSYSCYLEHFLRNPFLWRREEEDLDVGKVVDKELLTTFYFLSLAGL